MENFGKLSVYPELPEEISGLEKLAQNLWWCWNYKAEELFEIIDAELWEDNKNPIIFLSKVSHKRLLEVVENEEFMKQYQNVMNQFNEYLAEENTWFDQNFSGIGDDQVIAYFSAEFGFHESLPIYSGGLGVLAGDHCKSASDLGLPFVGVGLFYEYGYFKQRINKEGWQKALYPELDTDDLPLETVTDEAGNELKIEVKLADRMIKVKVWKVEVGRVKVYLLDTNVPENSEQDKQLTSRLYGGGDETRIAQEIVLGVGGTRALYELGYEPVVWHMNEGHSVYLGLERIKDLMDDFNLDFNEALETVAANSVFTTHTPVPAGNETFPLELKERYFSDYWKSIGLTKEEFMELGYVHEEDSDEFCLTVLALRLAQFSNGVSELHGEVSSEMWEDIWPDVPKEENPIDYITNGIHTLTWLAPEWEEVLDDYLGDGWRNNIEDEEMWQSVENIPEEEFWQVHKDLKGQLIDHIRDRDLERRKRYSNVRLANSDLLDKDTLTIGFARRFATYKRANLIFRDLERLRKICNQEGKEVQLIFAGKAHPADVPGQELIKEIHDISQREAFKDKVIILEDYDMNLARYLVRGVDVWLNNPRRPLEASGTSGQKVSANGGLNFSVLDGWWVEGYNGYNGWAIGYEAEYDDRYKQDEIDSESLYEILEDEIVPLYYDHDNENGIPVEWVKRMKNAMKTTAPVYSTDRMVQEYTQNLYMPAYERGKEVQNNDFAKAKELAAWKDKVRSNWNQVKISSQSKGDQGEFAVQEKLNVGAKVDLGNLAPEDVTVELYLVSNVDEVPEAEIIPMDLDENVRGNIYSYSMAVKLEESGDYEYTFRVVPNDDDLSTKHELGLIEWI
ncbi:alpha-glucan family phosphorylase [Halanaerobacter jeridensis]|uniref:Starch phosphorylase n=1 Tax=Halanaerobacter jeridensis TaxID=706427 RepID=A0A939BMH7_9FIRM|nr:alpha-glucan family phosphorylase [Halanaerobacter jeridensis]MBM7556505.1 starch phosphorylase [Halanaerobacter jeridensis]